MIGEIHGESWLHPRGVVRQCLLPIVPALACIPGCGGSDAGARLPGAVSGQPTASLGTADNPAERP